jgi:K+ transporter
MRATEGVIPNKNQRHRSVPRVELIYVVLSRLATRTPEFFRIPPDQVIELGARVEI